MAQLGILLCDDHPAELVAETGSYDQAFLRMFAAVGYVPTSVAVWRCFEGEMPSAADHCDNFLISGSKWSVYDDEPWIKELVEFIRQGFNDGQRFVGICFGHQLIHHALGGEVGPAGFWGLGAYPVDVVQPFASFRAGDSLKVLAVHQDQVKTMAAGVQRLAGSELCPNAITASERLLTVQAHPEFSDQIFMDVTGRVKERAGDALAQNALSKLGEVDQREEIARWIADFIEQR